MKKLENFWFWLSCFVEIVWAGAVFYAHPQEGLLTLKIAVLLLISIVLILQSLAFLKNRSLRKRGLVFPIEGATLEDVKILLEAGERISAIKLYRNIHHASLRDTVEAIDKLQVASSNL